MDKQPDFIAELKYLTTAEGGRKTPAFSKYRPQVKFAFSEMQTSGQQTFIGTDKVYPGEKVTAAIAIITTDFFVGLLEPGTAFDFMEGAKVIGTGIVTEILNPVLRKS